MGYGRVYLTSPYDRGQNLYELDLCYLQWHMENIYMSMKFDIFSTIWKYGYNEDVSDV